MVVFLTYSVWLDLFETHSGIYQLEKLGYPSYLPPFMALSKILAILALLVTKLPRLTEMAYYGLGFEMSGVLYSHALNCHFKPCLILPLVILVLVSISYYFYEKKFDDLLKAGLPKIELFRHSSN